MSRRVVQYEVILRRNYNNVSCVQNNIEGQSTTNFSVFLLKLDLPGYTVGCYLVILTVQALNSGRPINAMTVQQGKKLADLFREVGKMAKSEVNTAFKLQHASFISMKLFQEPSQLQVVQCSGIKRVACPLIAVV